MEDSLARVGSLAADWSSDALVYFREPSTLFQLTLIVGAFLAAWLLARFTGPAIEVQARQIKGAPGVLRIIIAFLRRLRLVYFVLLLWLFSLLDGVAGGPRSRLIAIVFSLSLAYLVIAVALRVLRNRLLARIITVVAWGLAALSILDLAEPVALALDRAAITVGQARISALLVVKAIAVIALTLWIATVVGRLLDSRVQRSEELTPTLRVLIGKFLRIGLIIFGLTVALASVGVDLTALTVLSGAVGVGIGFGLQKVVSNFLSGIIILLDRSIKPGDTISLGETFGWIRELRARFVSVVTRDGKEYLIPNEDFITNQVINWSFSDDLVRISVPFGVAYNSDPHQVIRIAKEAALGVGRVAKEKDAVCWMTGFGESSLDFEVRFWIHDPPAGIANVKGQVLLALWDAFKANNVSIPFPHREIIMRTPVTLAEPLSSSARANGEDLSVQGRRLQESEPAHAP